MTLFVVILAAVVLLLLLGVPVAYAFGMGALAYVWATGQSLDYMLPYAFWQIGSFALLALPLFVLVGQLMSASGAAARILDFIELLVGRVRGGLGAVTVIACALVGAIAGSGSSAIAAVGGLMIERMSQRGYSRGYAVALVACSSVIAQLIPPSIPMIVFALLTGISVTAAFLSTVVPGILIVLAYCTINAFCAPRDQAPVARFEGAFFNEFRQRFSRASLALMMPVIMLGGIYSGIFTPTEAAAVGVGYVMLLGLTVYRQVGFKGIARETMASAEISGAIIAILFAMAILSRAMLLEQIPVQISEFLVGISESPWVLMLMLNLILLFIGMLVDDVSGNIVAVIVLYPVAKEMGLHPLHFAAIVGVNLGLGNVTPPCAPLLYMAGGIGKASLPEYMDPALRFMLLGHLPVLLAVTFMPDLALALPRLLLGVA